LATGVFLEKNTKWDQTPSEEKIGKGILRAVGEKSGELKAAHKSGTEGGGPENLTKPKPGGRERKHFYREWGK